MKKIVLLRHGESTWNRENRFTGWTDVDLSEKGVAEAEKAALLDVAAGMVREQVLPCTACRYCTDGCPKHISIPDLFAIMNTKQIHHDWNADCYYEDVHTAPGRKASDCLKCGKCEKACPQHLPIRQLLEQVSQEFDKAR